jgi:hypothetical protein
MMGPQVSDLIPDFQAFRHFIKLYPAAPRLLSKFLPKKSTISFFGKGMECADQLVVDELLGILRCKGSLTVPATSVRAFLSPWGPFFVH